MTAMTSKVGLGGSLAAKKVNQSPGFMWKLRNKTRLGYLRGLLAFYFGPLMGKLIGFGTFVSELRAVRIDGQTGKRTDYGVVSRRVVTTAWVNFLVDQLQTETSAFGDLRFHDSGTGTTAAAIGDTDIETGDGIARSSGTQTEGGSANVYRSVGTITYTGTAAITEHGIFNALTGGTLADRHVFSAINVVNTDQIEFTYDMTYAAGG